MRCRIVFSFLFLALVIVQIPSTHNTHRWMPRKTLFDWQTVGRRCGRIMFFLFLFWVENDEKISYFVSIFSYTNLRIDGKQTNLNHINQAIFFTSAMEMSSWGIIVWSITWKVIHISWPVKKRIEEVGLRVEIILFYKHKTHLLPFYIRFFFILSRMKISYIFRGQKPNFSRSVVFQRWKWKMPKEISKQNSTKWKKKFTTHNQLNRLS